MGEKDSLCRSPLLYMQKAAVGSGNSCAEVQVACSVGWEVLCNLSPSLTCLEGSVYGAPSEADVWCTCKHCYTVDMWIRVTESRPKHPVTSPLCHSSNTAYRHIQLVGLAGGIMYWEILYSRILYICLEIWAEQFPILLCPPFFADIPAAFHVWVLITFLKSFFF